MSDIYLELTIANWQDLEKQTEVDFLVDSGATRAWIPEEIAEKLDLKPLGAIEVELADGTIKELPYSACLFDFGGERVAGNVMIGPRGSEALAGTHLLQDFRLVIDFDRHKISRSRALRAK